MVLFDTNCWITLLKARCPVLQRRWASVAAGDLLTCSVVKAELWHGALKYHDPAGRRRIVDEWLAPYRSLPFDDAAAERYADLRHTLEVRGEIIGPKDLKIAAICLAHDLTLVSANVTEFQRVPNLRVEDWSRE
jgi:tRNA(fMet)-specific endonuclease VapC